MVKDNFMKGNEMGFVSLFGVASLGEDLCGTHVSFTSVWD